MSDELKPCPHCKGPAALVDGDGPFIGRCQVECTHCRIATYWYDEAVVVAQWNRRAQPAPEVQPVPDDIQALHRKLAGEILRADLGWSRYKAANAARNAAEAALAEMHPQALRRLLKLIGNITKLRYQMSYNDSYFGEPAGLLKRTVRDIEKLLDRVRVPVAPETEAARLRQALEEIALAGMSGTGQESPDGLRDWHARRAWEFIGIAARAIDGKDKP